MSERRGHGFEIAPAEWHSLIDGRFEQLATWVLAAGLPGGWCPAPLFRPRLATGRSTLRVNDVRLAHVRLGRGSADRNAHASGWRRRPSDQRMQGPPRCGP